MKCPRCQQENPQGARFCNACGTRLDVTCAACGHVNSPESRFCNQCGQPVGASTPADTAQRFGSPQSHTPEHLVEKILTSRSALEGERKQVTVLFADMKGSMELLADRQEAARDTALAALEFAEQHGQRGQAAWVCRLLGEIARLHPSLLPHDAEYYHRGAMTPADALGMRPLIAHCHLGLGKLSARTGKRQEAQEHLTVATTMYREMGMRFWLEQAELETAALAG